jgi:hypothetical protein
VSLRPAVVADLARHGIDAGPGDAPETLRERLNDAYLEDIRRLKALQVAGEIPLKEYAARVQTLKDGYPLLGLPLAFWTE